MGPRYFFLTLFGSSFVRHGNTLLTGVYDASLRNELDALEAKRRGGEQDAFTPPRLAENFVSAEWDRLERSASTLSAEKQKVGLDTIFTTVLADAWPKIGRRGGMEAVSSTVNAFL